MKEDNALKKALVLTLCFALFVSMMPVGFIPSKTKAASRYPKDGFTITKIRDGTHDGPGRETFINSKNGFSVADDTIDDGVVASGDWVSYKYKLTCAAGARRTIKVKLTQSFDGLHMEDFGNVVMSNALVRARFDKKNTTWSFDIPRGAVCELEGVFHVKAKDTKGEVVENNVVSAVLTNERYTYKSQAEPVTVVSVPFADLAVDSLTAKNNYINRKWTQDTKSSEFYIDPVPLQMEGYSTAGLTASGMWHTDVDVSEFPDGTTWSMDGKELEVKNGKLKDLKGEGTKALKYSLPETARPSEKTNGAKLYTIKLEPYEDSFKAGDSLNIKDIGIGEDKTYDTSKFRIDGKKVGALSGVTEMNNNYGTVCAMYVESPPPRETVELDWDYNTYRPYDDKETLFDRNNVYYNARNDWFDQGSWTGGYNKHKITMDNDLYSVISINAKKFEKADVKKMFTGETLNRHGVDKDHRKIRYDMTRDIIVKQGDKVISPENYKIEFRTVKDGDIKLNDDLEGASRFIESNKAPNKKVNQYRITFKDGAIDTAGGAKWVDIYAPLKALDNYDVAEDISKLVSSTAVFDLEEKTASEGVTKEKYQYAEKTWYETLIFPTKPSVRASIKTEYEKPKVKYVNDENTGVYETKFSVSDKALSLPTSYGYNAKRVLTFADVYDLSTFKLVTSNGWKVESIKGNKVTLVRNNFDMFYGNYDEQYNLGDITFTVDSIYSLNSKVGDIIEGFVNHDVYLEYPKVGSLESGEVTSHDSTVYKFDSMRDISAVLSSDFKETNVSDDLSYSMKLMTNRKGFSEEIILPYNGDIKLMDDVNKANKTHIKIDDKTGLDTADAYDGIGRSKFHGTYKIKSMTLNNTADDAVVYFIYDGKTYKLDVKDKKVDIDKIKDIKLSDKEARIKVKSNKTISENQGAGFDAKIELSPTDNKVDDAYVMHLAQTNTFDEKDNLMEKIAWPDYIKVVPSSLSGYVFHDKNENGTYDEDEKGFKGVSVSLYIKEGDSYVKTGQKMLTDNKGYYEFKDLKKGDYKVYLDNLVRKKDSAEFLSVNGSTNDTAKEGNLPMGKENRFGIYEKTTQTYSYPNKYKKWAGSDAVETVKVKSNVKNINFGYNVHSKDLALDVKPAEVSYSWGSAPAEVSWDIIVKNTGDEAIEGAKLFNRTSKEVKGVESSLGYKQVYKTITGDFIKMIGDYPLIMPYSSSQGGGLIITTDGIWLLRGGHYSDLDYISGITGEFIDADGVQPYGHKLEAAPGSLVATTDGVYHVNGDGRSHKLKDIIGTPLKVISSYPTEDPSLIVTTNGVWVLRRSRWKDESCENVLTFDNPNDDKFDVFAFERYVDTCERLYTVGCKYGLYSILVEDWDNSRDTYVSKLDEDCMTGTILGMSGFVGKHKRPYHSVTANGCFIATTDGIWSIYGNKSIKKIQGIKGRVIELNAFEANEYGGIIVTDEGFYHTDIYGHVEEITNISGNFVDMTGEFGRTDSVIATTDGLWVIESSHERVGWNDELWCPIYKTHYTCNKLENIEGTPIKLTGIPNKDSYKTLDKTQGVGLITSKGVYLVGMNGKIHKCEGFTGTPLHLYGDKPLSLNISANGSAYNDRGMLLWTTDGLWKVMYDGTTTTDLPIGVTESYIEDENTSPVHEENVGDYVSREYNLPRIEPGEEVVCRIKGTVERGKEDLIVGNQSYVTSDMTPRSGIKTSKVTGKGQKPGVPDLPVLSDETFNRFGIKGTETVSLNSSIDIDACGPDDLADQTPARIPKTSKEPPKKISIDGYAWYDMDKNGLRDDDKPAPNIKVTIRDDKNSIIYDEVKTDENGYWSASVPEGRYEVHYDVLNHEHDNKIWKVTKRNVDNSDKDSDVDEAGYTKILDIKENGSDNHGKADCGLVATNPGISLTKANKGLDSDIIYASKELQDTQEAVDIKEAKLFDKKTRRLFDEDKDERTVGYDFKITNTGDEPLTNITLKDKTIKGNPAKISSRFDLYRNGSVTKDKIMLNDEGIFVKDERYDKSPITLNKGDEIRGYYDVPFSKGNDVHEDEMEVNAVTKLAEDTYGTQVSDKDGFKVSYKYVPRKPIKINKIGAASVDDKARHKKLEGVSFKLYKQLSDGGEKLLGTYATSDDGSLEVVLPEGDYRISETKAPAGYQKADEKGWMINVRYDEKGNGNVSVKSSSDMPYIEAKNGDLTHYLGEVDIYNYKLINIPETGGKVALIILGGAVVLLIGLSLRKKFE